MSYISSNRIWWAEIRALEMTTDLFPDAFKIETRRTVNEGFPVCFSVIPNLTVTDEDGGYTLTVMLRLPISDERDAYLVADTYFPSEHCQHSHDCCGCTYSGGVFDLRRITGGWEFNVGYSRNI